MIFVCISLGQTVPHQFTLDNPISSINGNAKKPRASFDSVHEPCRKQSLEQTPHILQVGRNLLKHTHSASHRGTLESKKLQSTLAATSTHV